jgi:hypothetical protein
LATTYSFWALGYFFAPDDMGFIYKSLYMMGLFLTSSWMLRSYTYILLFLLVTPISVSFSLIIYNRYKLKNNILLNQNIVDLKNRLAEKIEEKDTEIEKIILRNKEIDKHIQTKVATLYNAKRSEFTKIEEDLKLKKKQINEQEKNIISKYEKIKAYLKEIDGLQRKVSIKNKRIAELKGTTKKACALIKENNIGYALRILKVNQ